MHGHTLDWAKQALPMDGQVLDVGSLNVNGSLRSVLPVTYGIDMRAGKDVDEVCNAVDLLERFGAEYFDHVVTSDCFEHVEFWEPALRNAWGVLKTGGKFLFSVPTQEKGFHSHPYDYWRWTVPLLEETFKDQTILVCGKTWEHGVGIICRKVKELNYVQPLPVLGAPKPKKEKKKK